MPSTVQMQQRRAASPLVPAHHDPVVGGGDDLRVHLPLGRGGLQRRPHLQPRPGVLPVGVRPAGHPVVPGQRRRPADADLGMGVSQEPGGVTLLDGGEHLQHHSNVGIGVHIRFLPVRSVGYHPLSASQPHQAAWWASPSRRLAWRARSRL